MKQIETERLVLRELQLSDEDRFFLMDSNPEVVKFIEPVKNREQIRQNISSLLDQYKENGKKQALIVWYRFQESPTQLPLLNIRF